MKLLYIIILLSIPYTLFSQDDLKKLIKKFDQSSSVIDKAKFASDIAWGLKDINPDSSLFYAKQALKYSIKSNQKEIEAFSLSDIGNYYKRKESYKIALEYYLKSLDIRKSIGDLKIIAGGYNQLGLLYKQQEKYDSASVYFSTGILIIRKTEYKDELLRLYDGYAMNLYHLGEAETALAYLDSTFILAEQIDDELTIAKSVQNKGVINQYLGHNRLALKFYEKAEEYYKSSGNINGQIEVMINQSSVLLSLGEKGRVEHLLLDAEKLSLSFGFKDNLYYIYMDLAQLYKSKNSKLRKVYLQKAYDNTVFFSKLPGQVECGIALGLLALEIGEIDEASHRIKEVEDITINMTRKSQFNFYILKSRYFESIHNYEQALIYSQRALTLKDNLSRDLNDLQDMSALLENERQEKKIALEELRTSIAEKESIQASSSRDRVVIWSLILGLILLTLLVLGKRKRLKIEHEKKIQEERFKLELMQRAHETDLLFLEESLSLETNIRQKIGRDLHDHLGSKLAVVQIKLDSIVKHTLSDDSERIQFDDVIDLVEKSCKDVRVIAHDLISHDFSTESLDKSFYAHCKSISDSGHLKVNYGLIGNPYPISINSKKHIYATVILLIDNIVRHARANNANLQLFYHDDCINIELDDDGIGFNSNVKKRNRGVGIDNAEQRIKKINGSIEIHGKENHGTFISISIPINNE